MKKILVILAVIIGAGYFFWWKEPSVAPTVESGESSAEMPAESVQPPAAPQGEAVPLESENIKVTSPAPNVTITSPFVVSGEARVFENVVNVRVTNTQGETLIAETAYAKAPDIGQFGPFSINLSYQFQSTKEGFVEVYSQSPKDGSDENVVRIPVRFE